MKFYENPDVHLRKIDEKLVKSIVDKIFEAIMKNYSPNNPVYISDYSPDDDDSKESSSEFGLSTNYILLLFFILDRHFSVFKVLFRISTLRKYIKIFIFWFCIIHNITIIFFVAFFAI